MVRHSQCASSMTSAGSLLLDNNIGPTLELAGELLQRLPSSDENRDQVIVVDGIENDDNSEDNNQSFDGAGYDTVDAAISAIVLPDEEEKYQYDMLHKERGCFLIFSMEVFDSKLNLTHRIGTRKDAHIMFHIAKLMGFEYIKTFHDAKREDVIGWLCAVSKACHSIYDSFGCAILTHGDEGDILYAKDAPFHLSECTSLFTADRCPSLAGKPKLFFVQACRGAKRDRGAKLPLKNASKSISKVNKAIPNHADVFIACSTTPGYTSCRNTSKGSWFVQSLHHCFSKYSQTLELIQIMTRVNRRVALYFETYPAADDNGYKQIPFVSSQLTMDVYFYKRKVDNPVCQVCSMGINRQISSSCSSKTEEILSSSEILEEKKDPANKETKSSFVTWVRKSFRKSRRKRRN